MLPEKTDDRLILLSPDDNVLVVRAAIDEGEVLQINGDRVTVVQALSMGHKVARSRISVGEKILKYGAPIGSATAEIRPGDHVHLHNLKSDYTATHSLYAAKEKHRTDGAAR